MVKKDIAVLEFGSSSITVIVGERGVNSTMRIKAMKEAEYAGFQNAEFLEPENVKMAMAYAIANAEIELGSKISELYIGVPGEFTCSVVKEIQLNFSGRKKINDNDIRQAFYVGNNFKKHPTHSSINQSAVYYTLDDGRRVIDPKGMVSTKLKAVISYILAENNFIDFVDNILRELNIARLGYISSALAEMLYLFDPNIRDRYALLVDLGYITTSVMLGRGDGLLFLNSFSMGGGHITGDLATCLKIPFSQAESLKRKLVLSWNAGEDETYEVAGKEFISPISAKLSNDIAEDRISVICDYILKCLERCEYEFPEYLPLYLTGGGVNFIKGASKIISQRLGRRVELVSPKFPHNSRPDYSSEIGLLNAAVSFAENSNNYLICR